jgi:zinc/manganese transport system substrate-binding protein
MLYCIISRFGRPEERQSVGGAKIKPSFIFAVVVSLLAVHTLAWAGEPVPVVAAENFYGDIAQQIGGSDVAVTSILSNSDQDPHLFEVSPSAARVVSRARIVILNGIDYDPWMERLLSAARRTDRKSIVVADLVRKKPGDNPHLWYNPMTMLAAATALADELSSANPARRGAYAARLAQFKQSLQPIQAKIAALRGRWSGTPVTATEPIFQYMFDALGMQVRDAAFQLAVMNDTEPSASDVAGFESDLKTHRVKLLIYNRQASDPVADRMVKFANAAHIPVVGVTETEPPGKNYQAWMLSALDAVDHALTDSRR